MYFLVLTGEPQILSIYYCHSNFFINIYFLHFPANFSIFIIMMQALKLNLLLIRIECMFKNHVSIFVTFKMLQSSCGLPSSPISENEQRQKKEKIEKFKNKKQEIEWIDGKLVALVNCCWIFISNWAIFHCKLFCLSEESFKEFVFQ